MAKRAVKEKSEQRVKVSAKKLDEPTVRMLQLQHPARVKHQGKETGTWYEWPGAGAVVAVASEDAEYLLTLMRNAQPCCNSVNIPQPKFVEV